MNLPVPVISALIGVVILFFGRKLFWLCVAAVGFAAGVELAPHLVQEPTPILALSVAIVLGFVGALIAMFLQKIAIAIVGFLAGGKLAVAIVATFVAQQSVHVWLVFVIGGIVGAILLLSLFDLALIFISSVIGAYLIGRIISLPPTGGAVLFALLVIVGVLVQAASFRRMRAATNP
jgi:hypothetical protein